MEQLSTLSPCILDLSSRLSLCRRRRHRRRFWRAKTARALPTRWPSALKILGGTPCLRSTLFRLRASHRVGVAGILARLTMGILWTLRKLRDFNIPKNTPATRSCSLLAVVPMISWLEGRWSSSIRSKACSIINLRIMMPHCHRNLILWIRTALISFQVEAAQILITSQTAARAFTTKCRVFLIEWLIDRASRLLDKTGLIRTPTIPMGII